jgi:hypothetical protein
MITVQNITSIGNFDKGPNVYYQFDFSELHSYRTGAAAADKWKCDNHFPFTVTRFGELNLVQAQVQQSERLIERFQKKNQSKKIEKHITRIERLMDTHPEDFI